MLFVALQLLTLVGCYRSHGRDEPRVDAGEDAGREVDAGMRGPCTSRCEAPRLLASVQLVEENLSTRAVLDLAPAPDGLLALLWAGDGDIIGMGTRVDYRVLHIPFAGDPEFLLGRTFTYWGVNAGSVRAVGTTIRAVMLTTEIERITSEQPTSVVISTWSAGGGEPEIESIPLREEPIAGCDTCRRLGAAIVQDDAFVVAAVADSAELHVARIAFADGSVERWSVPLPGSSPDAPVAGTGDGRGRALIVAGGALPELGGAYEGPAFGVDVSEEIGPAIQIPGGRFDPPPYAAMFDGDPELFRFLYSEDGVTGALHRYGLDTVGLREIGTIETANGFVPLGMTSTSRALLWVESERSLPGTANLRVLVHDAACVTESPTLAAGLPFPLVTADPRIVAATERDGHTLVMVVEDHGGDDERAVVIDLGRCEAVVEP
jgi:hypothetical protein